jgi:excisionase family DNA binding protein
MTEEHGGDGQDLLDVRGAAALVGRHPETVRRWVWSGRLAARRRGNRLLVSREDVEALAGGRDDVAMTLAAWADLVRASHTERARTPRGGSAADLVIEDRERRTLPARGDAGR